MQVRSGRGDARERLLHAAATLLSERGSDEASTRAICEAAGVQAPTLYHHFGNKQGLLDAVVAHGFEQYLSRKRGRTSSGDPIADIRDGWDDHVDFGLQNPAFYALMWGSATPGQRPAAAGEAERILLGLFLEAQAQGRLEIDPAAATTQFLSAVVGMTLFLITQPSPTPAQRESSTTLRDTLLNVFTSGRAGGVPASGATQPRGERARSGALARAAEDLARAVTLNSGDLDGHEVALLQWWLERLRTSSR